jgi:hypothetical protein
VYNLEARKGELGDMARQRFVVDVTGSSSAHPVEDSSETGQWWVGFGFCGRKRPYVVPGTDVSWVGPKEGQQHESPEEYLSATVTGFMAGGLAFTCLLKKSRK